MNEDNYLFCKEHKSLKSECLPCLKAELTILKEQLAEVQHFNNVLGSDSASLAAELDEAQRRLSEAEGFIAAFLHGDIDQEGWENALKFLKGKSPTPADSPEKEEDKSGPCSICQTETTYLGKYNGDYPVWLCPNHGGKP